jgi:hypothetical protein
VCICKPGNASIIAKNENDAATAAKQLLTLVTGDTKY